MNKILHISQNHVGLNDLHCRIHTNFTYNLSVNATIIDDYTILCTLPSYHELHRIGSFDINIGHVFVNVGSALRVIPNATEQHAIITLHGSNYFQNVTGLACAFIGINWTLSKDGIIVNETYINDKW